ncbi:hypothetical protein L7F22_047264 [Adiantum nelumboides]|nr:hypothetical protein [Adiantum nelumboides]
MILFDLYGSGCSGDVSVYTGKPARSLPDNEGSNLGTFGLMESSAREQEIGEKFEHVDDEKLVCVINGNADVEEYLEVFARCSSDCEHDNGSREFSKNIPALRSDPITDVMDPIASDDEGDIEYGRDMVGKSGRFEDCKTGGEYICGNGRLTVSMEEGNSNGGKWL